jgi:hypothetical protein
VKAAQNSTGFALYWQCTVNGVAGHHGFLGTWASLEPDWMAQLSAAIAAGSFSALWDAKITGPSEASKYDAVRPLYEALKAANPLPATVSTYKVAPNGTYTTRPAYALVNGSRTSTLAGRVAVGSACDCNAFKSGTGTSTYCAVTGNENTATAAVDQLSASAAICTQ